MADTLRVVRGQRLEFPVAPDHPLAAHQGLRAPTREELLKHPFYAAVVQRQTRLAAANVSGALTNSILDGILRSIGFGNEIVLNGTNIIVEPGGYLSIKGSWNWLTANEFIIEDGGLVYVYSGLAALPAFLLLKCNTFGSR
jgi:hypothetical protein